MHMNRSFSVHMNMNRRLAAICCHHQCAGLEWCWGEINFISLLLDKFDKDPNHNKQNSWKEMMVYMLGRNMRNIFFRVTCVTDWIISFFTKLLFLIGSLRTYAIRTIRLCSIGINLLNCNRFRLKRLRFPNRTLFQPFSVEMVATVST